MDVMGCLFHPESSKLKIQTRQTIVLYITSSERLTTGTWKIQAMVRLYFRRKILKNVYIIFVLYNP